jgi:hypothetical protein
MCLWALNNNHPILVRAKHLFKMGCSSNILPEVQEITQLLTIALSSSKIIQPDAEVKLLPKFDIQRTVHRDIFL